MRLGCFYGAPHKIADHYKRRCFRPGSSIRLRLIGELRALAGWAFYCRAIRSVLAGVDSRKGSSRREEALISSDSEK